MIRSWIDFFSVDAHTLADYFIQFTYSTGGFRARRFFMQLIWLACVWVVWSERNHKLFRGSASSLQQLLDNIKSFSFTWLQSTNATVAYNSHRLWSNPMLCLGLYNLLLWFFSVSCNFL
jgi:hypothetical protein